MSSISSVTASSTSAVQMQRPQGPSKEIREGIDQLKTSIESGDLDATQKAYDSLSKLAGDQSSGTQSASGSGNSSNPLSKMLSAVGDALKSGDMSQVQKALEANGPKGAGGPGGRGGAGGPPPNGGPGGAAGPSDEVKSAMGNLGQSLQSGDLTSAQNSFTSLAQMLSKSLSSSSSSTSSSSSSSSSSGKTSGTGSSASAAADRFATTLQNLGSALQSGDLSGAQKLFSSLAPRGSQGVDVSA